MLIVQGADDAYGTTRQLDLIAGGVRGPCSRVVLDGVGHAPHLEAPEATLAAVTDFVVGARPAIRALTALPDSRWAKGESVSTTSNGPLEGLRVVELTDATGRFAGKVLAESGASVARIGRLTPGPAMRDADIGRRGGLLEWWLDGGTRWIDADLATADGQAVYRRLAERADLVIETQPPGRLGELGVDHADISDREPGPRAGRRSPRSAAPGHAPTGRPATSSPAR